MGLTRIYSHCLQDLFSIRLPDQARQCFDCPESHNLSYQIT
jgi:hypothetical protein